jgi:hypothetical protein
VERNEHRKDGLVRTAPDYFVFFIGLEKELAGVLRIDHVDDWCHPA